MNKLKNIIIVSLFLILSFLFVSCSSSPTNNGNNNTNNGKNESEVSQTEISLKLGKIYNEIYTNLDDKTEDCYARNSGKQAYEDYVYAGILALKELSEIKELSEDKVYYGNEITLNEFSGNYANKIQKLYITNSKKGEQNEIKIYIVGSRANFSESPLNIILFAYSIFYNEKNLSLNLECNIEKANGSSFNSDSNNYNFTYNYDSRFNSREIKTYSYYRTQNFDYTNGTESEIFTNVISNIKGFKRLYFDLSLNASYFPTNESNNLLKIGNNEALELVVSSLKQIDELNDFITSLKAEDNSIENLSKKLLTILNENRFEIKDEVESQE